MIKLVSPQPAPRALVEKLQQDWQRASQTSANAIARLAAPGADWEAIDARIKSGSSNRKVVVVGIGGSSLGAQVIYSCFRARSQAHVFFLEAVDPYKWEILKRLGPEWRDAHFVLVSKSGGTLETLTWIEKLKDDHASWIQPDHCTVICSPGNGSLQALAAREGLPLLEIPSTIGGRFSVLTAVGMFPAGLMGLDLEEFRHGANWSLSQTQLAAELAAHIVMGWESGEWVTQLWTYAEALKVFGQWWQQLWSESLAKKINRRGQPGPRVSTPMNCLGPRDQHSLLQQLIEGYRDKHVILTRFTSLEDTNDAFVPKTFSELPFHNKKTSLGKVLRSEAEAFAQCLVDSQIHFTTLEVTNLSERTLGALFMLWQVVVATLGEHLDIDAFNQPGVELGKRHAEKILRR